MTQPSSSGSRTSAVSTSCSATPRAAVGEAVAVLTDHDPERRWTEENARSLRAFCGIDVVADQYIALYGELDGEPEEP